MKFNVVVDGQKKTVEGREAYPVIKQLFRLLGEQLLLPTPPFTTKARRFAKEALRRGESASDQWGDDGKPNGRVIVKVAR